MKIVICIFQLPDRTNCLSVEKGNRVQNPRENSRRPWSDCRDEVDLVVNKGSIIDIAINEWRKPDSDQSTKPPMSGSGKISAEKGI